MIWYEEAHDFPDQPKTIIVGVKGVYENSRIKISVMMYGAGEIEVVYFNQIVGSTMNNEEATKELIYEKYKSKIERIIETMGDSFIEWLPDLQRRLCHQEKKMYYFDHEASHWFYVPESKYVESPPEQLPKDGSDS